MERTSSKDENLAIESYVFVKTHSFKYIATITGNNDWNTENGNRIN